MKKLQFVWILLGAGSAAFATPRPASWSLNLPEGSAGSVEFRATGRPSALKIVGKGAAPHGSFTVKNGTVSGSALFEISSLSTGISMRDHHMKDRYLEAGKYPEAKLTLTQAVFPETVTRGGAFSEASVPFSGTLLLHGVEKPVSGTLKVGSDGKSAHVDAQFALKLEDYGIAIPSFSGITMASAVDVNVQASGPIASGK